MPLVRISLRSGTPPEYRRALADGVHRALVAAAGVPAADRFQVVEELPAESFHFDSGYLGFERGPGTVFVQVFLNSGRTVEVKRALYAALADELGQAGLRRDDLLVSLVEVARENWSFGGGLMSYPPPT